MKRYFVFGIILLTITGSSSLNGEIFERFNQYHSVTSQEKVYAHLDKMTYLAGDTLWYKLYLVDAKSHEPASSSGVVHIDLIDERNKVILSQSSKVSYGGAYGDIQLPSYLNSGTYRFRAYTNWMRNFDQDFFFSKSIQVLNNNAKPTYGKCPVFNAIKFFPEGGELVTDLTSIVAFRAIDDAGKGIAVEGIIIDEEGNEINSFETEYDGMGRFLLTPKKGRKYFAVIDGVDKSYPLSDHKSSGAVIRLLNSYENDQFSILVASKNKELKNSSLFIHQSGNVVDRYVSNSRDDSFILKLEKEKFPEGICHVTLMDENLLPLAERLMFINYPDSSQLVAVKSNKKVFKDREEVIIEGDLGKLPSLFDFYNLSVSVTAANWLEKDQYKQNIRNYLNLTSELRGPIQHPEYYFQESAASYKYLDYLMMINGWRRFNWAELINGQFKPQYIVEEGLSISGRMLDVYNKKKPRYGHVSLYSSENPTEMNRILTDSSGYFMFANLDIPDSINIFLQGRRFVGKKQKTRNDVFIELQMDKPIVAGITNPILLDSSELESKMSHKNIVDQIARQFLFKGYTMLDAVEVVGVKSLQNDPFQLASTSYGTPSNRIVTDSLKLNLSANSAFDLIRSVPGVQISGFTPNQSAKIRETISFHSTKPLYLLNGQPIDEQVVNNLNPQNISFIDVLKGADASYYGSRGSGGVIAFYMKPGTSYSIQNAPGILNFKHPGYSRVREFYMPDYSTPMDIHAMPDYRSTLYWNPEILRENNHEFSFQFYTGDLSGQYIITIEGITSTGLPVFVEDYIEVQ